MFGFSDLLALVISAFIILPVVIFIREFGYLLVTYLFGVENPRLTIGSGPRIFKLGVFDIRKYYHLYSWFSFDNIKRKSNFSYIMIYASPILTNTIVAVILNALIANGYLEDQAKFWNRFIFYAFYYVLFDSVPMIMTNGKPNNGMIIYELIRYGKRVDYNQNNVIPSTTQVDEDYEQEMKTIEKVQEEIHKENDSTSSNSPTERQAVQDQMQKDASGTPEKQENEKKKKEIESD